MIAPPKPPAPGDPEALIKEARERLLRRRLLGATAVAIVAALGLGAYALTGGSNRLGKSAATRRPASLPICRSDQLSGSAGFQGATQTMLGAVTLINTSATACSLPQQHPLVSISASGSDADGCSARTGSQLQRHSVSASMRSPAASATTAPPAARPAAECRPVVHLTWRQPRKQVRAKGRGMPVPPSNSSTRAAAPAGCRGVDPPYCSPCTARRFQWESGPWRRRTPGSGPEPDAS
jgi:hypothetical protein